MSCDPETTSISSSFSSWAASDRMRLVGESICTSSPPSLNRSRLVVISKSEQRLLRPPFFVNTCVGMRAQQCKFRRIQTGSARRRCRIPPTRETRRDLVTILEQTLEAGQRDNKRNSYEMTTKRGWFNERKEEAKIFSPAKRMRSDTTREEEEEEEMDDARSSSRIDFTLPVRFVNTKVREGISGQSFNSGHGISRPSHSRLSNSSDLW